MLRKRETEMKFVNHIVRVCSKLAQKEYNSRHEWVAKAMHWEPFERLKFDHATKWFMQKPESVQENTKQKILRVSALKRNHIIPARKSNIELINKKKNMSSSRLCPPGWSQNRKQKDREVLKPCERTKIYSETRNNLDTNCTWCM